MPKKITANKLMAKCVSSQDVILLINPPVIETRYSWIRWNQPLDLIKVGSFLKQEIGSKVYLFDSMLPDKNGEVLEEYLPRDRRYHSIENHKFPMRRFGKSSFELEKYIQNLAADNSSTPTQVWVTSLCSYWYETVAETCRIIRKNLPDAQIILLGNYPRYNPEHIEIACAADFFIDKSFELNEIEYNLDLYQEIKPSFLSLSIRTKTSTLKNTIKTNLLKGVRDFVFFDDDVLIEDGKVLEEVISYVKKLEFKPRFHLICGLNPSQLSLSTSKLLKNDIFTTLNFEQAELKDDILFQNVYKEIGEFLNEAGFDQKDNRLSGFCWIGRLHDDLEKIIKRSFIVLQTFGNLIFKPFTPVPGSEDYLGAKTYLEKLPLKDWSPHFFPLSEVNKIEKAEYNDMIRMGSFLNEKVKAQSFDFFRGTLGASFLKESFRREVWNLEPSPFRVVNQSPDL